MRHRLGALLAIGLVLEAGSACAAWQDDLAAEIRVSRGCSVAYLSQVVERTVDGRQVIFAKVHCEDGRVFDATRTGSLEPFDFKECQPAREPQAC
ncbi:MAG: hypothetical protein NZ555_10105 [Geminicoccaceae bacterium]|nr:hypothetical protein [Geminicoccaceae bacterium]MCX8100995.1 hypothetical protein [Geminicoccaceae bacterium]MDW8370890.1 hypothetical protein [Geminicoccaceae bacterium]